MNSDEPIGQAEWDKLHDSSLCSECELKPGCQTEPNFGCQAEEKKRRGGGRVGSVTCPCSVDSPA